MSFTSISVICSVAVTNLHIRGYPHPVPNWMRSVLLVMSRVLCITVNHLKERRSHWKPKHWRRVPEASTVGNHSSTNGRVVHDIGEATTIVTHDDVLHDGATPGDRLLKDDNSQVNHALLETLKCLMNKQEETDRENKIHDEWKEVAIVIDRFLFLVFLLGMIVASVYILVALPLQKLQRFGGS